MSRILTILGARPQFIKAAPVSRAIAALEGMQEVLVHTGQHFDPEMSQVFFDQMGIPRPAYNLNIHSLPHGAMTGQMLQAAEKVMMDEKPDWVMVYGDTNSTLAGALAARKLGIRVAHVEAGLRSHNMNMPEETNRILTDRISNLLFCPTPVAVNNLLEEGYLNFPAEIIQTGDVMYDASLLFSKKSIAPASLQVPEKFVLASIHRAENTDVAANLRDIVQALNQISQQLPVVIPVHPRTRKILEADPQITFHPGVILIPPVGYLEMIYLLQHCSMVLTDSGGLQKEAYFFEKPCVTMREQTEWTELVDAGYNMVAGSNQHTILRAFAQMMERNITFRKGLYGDGGASQIIAESLKG